MGDFDSLQGSLPADVECVRLPVMKDDTDTMAAVKIALERGYESITLAGVLGGRLDHTFANFCVLQFIQQQGGKGQMADEATRVFYLSGPPLTCFHTDEHSHPAAPPESPAIPPAPYVPSTFPVLKHFSTVPPRLPTIPPVRFRVLEISPRIRLFLREENLGASRNIYELLCAARGTYIATCEGDDYWISPHKLQKQKKVMEENPACVGCVHPFQIVNEKEEPFSRKSLSWIREKDCFSFQDFQGLYLPRLLFLFPV